MSEDLIEQLRARMFEIDQELDALADDDFAGKHELNTEADTLKKQLAEVDTVDPETLRQWADRAGRKGVTVQDDEAAKNAIKGGAGFERVGYEDKHVGWLGGK